MEASAEKKDIKNILGSNHINGMYNFTEKDFINEGADKLLELGTKVIKVVLRHNVGGYYKFNSDWPNFTNLVDVAKYKYFKELFAKPFNTFVLMSFSPDDDLHYFLKGFTKEDRIREKNNMYELAKYLLTEYKNTGKTFVIQNWEGDWVLTPPNTEKEVVPSEAQGMIDWLNARQDGITQARDEVGTDGVMVVHAAEVNLLTKAMEGKPSVTNSVLPFTRCDLYSYSAYNTCVLGKEKFRESLDYLAKMAPDSKLYGKDNIYLGEFGWPENLVTEEERMKIIRDSVEVGLEFGARYILFWELYCDGPKHPLDGRPKNDDLIGNWLIRPDGTESPAWKYFYELLNKK